MKKEIAPLFASRLDEVKVLCEQLNIEELFFFGSSINGQFVEGKSDLDVLVNTDNEYMKSIVKLNIELRKMFGCSVDIFHTKWKKHQELKEYLKENKVLIYKR